MPKSSCWQQLCAVVVTLSLSSGAAFAQLNQLATRVPNTANALVIINAKAAYASPLAKAQGWDRRGLQAHRAGMIALPAAADHFLMAAEMDFEFMHPQWEIAVAHMRQLPAMKDIATHSGGRVDRLAGAQAVERPNDSFVVALGARVLGAMAPANRQHVIRWVRDARRRKSPELSPYLAEALQKAAAPANHIVMALDLDGILAPAEVADKLANKKQLLDEDADLDALSETIASIRGIRFEVELQNPPQGRLSLDFDQDATVLSKFAKPLLLAVLAKQGAGIDDIAQWQSRTAGKSIVLHGQLSQSGLRRVLSVLSSPVGPLAASSDGSTSADDAVAELSQWYFQSVTNYLNDLFLGDRRPDSLFQIKSWVERYARKIEDLDASDVDPEVVTFGRDVAMSLHEIVSVLNRAEQRSDIRESSFDHYGRSRYVRYGTYGTFEKSHVTRDRQDIQTDEASRGLETAQAIVDDLRDLSARTRQTMTKRYNRQF